MDKIPASIAILTLNSGQTLRRCLNSIKDFDDVYILDGNSTDGTLAIAKEFNVPVYKQYDTEEPNVRIKNFTEIRMKADALAKHDWIFWLDSDEYVSQVLVDDIRRILAAQSSQKNAYYAQKIMMMGDKEIKYSWHDSPYTMRLYNRQSGIVWKKSKAVHEKLFIPDDVRIVNIPHVCYSYFASFYREAVKKDNYYLSLVRQKMFLKNGLEKSNKLIIFSVIKNLLRAVNIFVKSVGVYARHGFKHSLPPRHVWRFMRYHIIISWYRVRQLFC